MLQELPNNVTIEKSCIVCKYYVGEREFDIDGDIQLIADRYCPHFPESEIPDDVYHNGHFTPRPDLGQKNDIVFTPRDTKNESKK